eukprot:CAMPEP_0197179686 /NCGR_PEP_ID=MMETSP1423-20130617/4550_1 /TAXON_ID=476441 /ORGANISM="Pseudo-nitzschia heimii, Strain UNC1101" /LENGTH=355 /DNA_ID=CAMNT_0042629629 /DNA_START=175 /DNA_END=1243 /DNA_ORIENTATION=+
MSSPPRRRLQDGCKKPDKSLPITLDNFDVKRGNFIEEPDPGKTSSAPGTDVSQVLGDAVLIRLDARSVLEFYQRRHDLEVVLVHPVSVGDYALLSIELVGISRKFVSEPDLVDRVRHVELFKGAQQHLEDGHHVVALRVVPPGRQVEAPTAAVQGYHAVYVASLVVLIDGGCLLLLALANALLDIVLVGQMPPLALVHPLDVVAGVAALALIAGAVTAPAGFGGVIVVVLFLQVFFGDPVLLRDLFDVLLQVLLAAEGAPLFELAALSDELSFVGDRIHPYAVLPDVVLPVQVKRLGLSAGILGVDVQQIAGNVWQRNVELDVEAGRGRRVHVHALRRDRLEVVAPFLSDQVHDC